MATRISVFASRELLNLLGAMRRWDRETRREIRQRTKAIVQPVWQQALNGNVQTRLEALVLAGSGRAQVSDQNVTLRAATSRRALSGGLRPKETWQPVEFGSNVHGTRRRTKTGKSVRVSTGAQFRAPNRRGYVFYPSAAQVIPRIASLWVQTAVRTFHELREGANS